MRLVLFLCVLAMYTVLSVHAETIHDYSENPVFDYPAEVYQKCEEIAEAKVDLFPTDVHDVKFNYFFDTCLATYKAAPANFGNVADDMFDEE